MNEFSICLATDEQTTQKLLKLRDNLEDSPYRDDTPHITLLRGITAPSKLEDDELLYAVNESLRFNEILPVEAHVDKVKNMSNQFYSPSGVILLEPTATLLELREVAIEKLKGNGYEIEQQEVDTYVPHITVRLGVPLDGDNMADAKERFPAGSSIQFSRWMLLRLIKDGDKRIMQELSPES